MPNLGRVTEEMINRSPFLREAISDGLINVSAVARSLIPELEKKLNEKVTEGAVVMTIKRMTPGLNERLNTKVKNVIGDLGDLIIREDLVDFTFRNTPSLDKKLNELMQLIHIEPNSFFTISKGFSESTIIVDSGHAKNVEQIFASEEMISFNKDLATITIALPTINSETYGIYYYILKQLAWEGINIVEVVSTANEFSVVVKKSDLKRAHEILTLTKQGL